MVCWKTNYYTLHSLYNSISRDFRKPEGGGEEIIKKKNAFDCYMDWVLFPLFSPQLAFPVENARNNRILMLKPYAPPLILRFSNTIVFPISAKEDRCGLECAFAILSQRPLRHRFVRVATNGVRYTRNSHKRRAGFINSRRS